MLILYYVQVFCVTCWKRTELLDQGPETLPTYNPILTLCNTFNTLKLGVSAAVGSGATKPPDKGKVGISTFFN